MISTPSSTAAAAPLLQTSRAAAPPRLADLLELAKPRLNFLVLVTTAVGYYLAARTGLDWARFLNTLLGTALTAAGASALNQLAERELDARMRRTTTRPLPAGRIRPGEALLFGATLSIAGLVTLAFTVNPLTALLGALTLLSYVFLYTPLKTRTTLCTVVGAIPGAIPPMMGWCAVRNQLTPEAWVLFTILFLWQMPHFLAIAILYRDDYARAGFRMLPVVDRSLAVTSRQIIVYCLCLLPAALLPTALHLAGPIYFTLALLLSLAFLAAGLRCAATRRPLDARRLFLASILYLPLLLAALMLDKT